MNKIVSLAAAVSRCDLNEEVFVKLTGYNHPFMRETTAQLAVEHVQLIQIFMGLREVGIATPRDLFIMRCLDAALRQAFLYETEYWDGLYRLAEELAETSPTPHPGIPAPKLRG